VSHQPYRRHHRLHRTGCIPPAADLGIAILSNASALPGALALTFAVHFHLLELLFDQPAEMDAQLFALAMARAAGHPHVDPAAVAPHLGRYTQPTLGEVRITWRRDQLVLEAGELVTELRARATDGPKGSVYLLHDRHSRSIPRHTGPW
jgi:hypothetical protein